MPHTTKKQRLEDDHRDPVAALNNFVASFDGLGVDELANIFGFLTPSEIMRRRRINKKSREAVKMTIVPPADFHVDSVRDYNGMRVMTTEMPNLQQITIRGLGIGHKYDDGEDPDERVAAVTADDTTHDIEIISNFSKLRRLELCRTGLYGRYPFLNGRYPVLFNSFPLLQKLSIQYCHHLKWDLEMLAGFPLLKELDCFANSSIIGNINSLRVLKDTLEKMTIKSCWNVEGNLMDLADFPHLKELDLWGTAVTGDIRDIGENDFLSLERLFLPMGVYGGTDYQLQRISDGPDLARAVYLLKKQRPALSMLGSWRGELSRDSPDWYEPADFNDDFILLSIHFLKAGSRIGYQWQTNGQWCEVNWLDPEPDRDSSEYTKYIEELRRMQRRAKLFKGLHQPPTEEEYNRLLEEYAERDEGSEESDSEDYREYNASDDDW